MQFGWNNFRDNLFWYRNLSPLRSKWHLACYRTCAVRRGCDWWSQRYHLVYQPSASDQIRASLVFQSFLTSWYCYYRFSFRCILERMRVTQYTHNLLMLHSQSCGQFIGEGGTFALYQGLYPPEDPDFDDRTLTGESTHKGSSFKKSGSTSLKETYRWPLLAWVR